MIEVPAPVDEYIVLALVVSCAAAALFGYAAPVAVPAAFVVPGVSVAEYGVRLAMPAVSRAHRASSRSGCSNNGNGGVQCLAPAP